MDPLNNEQKAFVLEALFTHLKDRAPFWDLFVERILSEHPDALAMQFEQGRPASKVEIKAGKLVAFVVRDFLLDAFGKLALLNPSSDIGDKPP